jgi:hypothetical protein
MEVDDFVTMHLDEFESRMVDIIEQRDLLLNDEAMVDAERSRVIEIFNLGHAHGTHVAMLSILQQIKETIERTRNEGFNDGWSRGFEARGKLDNVFAKAVASDRGKKSAAVRRAQSFRQFAERVFFENSDPTRRKGMSGDTFIRLLKKFGVKEQGEGILSYLESRPVSEATIRNDWLRDFRKRLPKQRNSE